MKEKFVDRRLQGSIAVTMDKAKGKWVADKAVICNHIITICEDYYRQGDKLTLRQLYYQLVSRDFIPNHINVYKKISKIKDDIVYAGLVDWNAIEDRGRVPISAYYEHSVENALQRTIHSYKLDRQIGQPACIEVWTEKDAISGILKKVTLPLTIKLVINKGYSSSSAMYKAYDRFIYNMSKGQKIVILYFGDHDPSGLDMIRDIRERLLFMFMNGEQQKDHELKAVIYKWAYDPRDFDFDQYEEDYGRDFDWSDLGDIEDQGWNHSEECNSYYYDEDCQVKYKHPEYGWEEYFEPAKAFFKHHFEIKHIGLTMEQIKKYNPPPNPAKITDPRAKEYVKQYGEVSWEVDALNPSVMRTIVANAIAQEMDTDAYDKIKLKEKTDIKSIKQMIKKISK